MKKETIYKYKADKFDNSKLLKVDPVGFNYKTLTIISQHPSVVYALENKPVMIYGMVKQAKDEAHVWMIPTEEFKKNKVSAIKHIKKVLGQLKYTHRLKKVTTQNNDYRKMHKWLTCLGFEETNSNEYIREL